MTNKQAIAIIRKAIKPTIQQLTFGASLYVAGLDEKWTARDYRELKRIEEALSILSEAGQLPLFAEIAKIG